MATLVLGGIGAVAGSVIPGAGWLAGMQAGMALGALYDQQKMLSQMEVGKVSDRTVSGSSYGAGLPLIWGRYRLGGNVVWAAKDSSGNHLFEFSESGGGKGGGPKSYRYEATVAAIFCTGEIVFPDGSSIHRNPDLKKLWGDDILVYDSSEASRYVLGSSLHFYDGAIDQAPSSVIIAKDGASSGDVCAYRGRAYTVMQDISLDDWGNRVPGWSAILETDPVTFGDLFSDLCRLKGLTAGQIDGSLATMPVEGACLMDGDDPWELLLACAQHFACDLVEVDGVLSLIPRGGSASLTVPEIELGTSTGSDQRPRVTRKRASRKALPSRVEVRFLDADADLQTGTQSDFRPEGSHQTTLQIDVPLVLTADEAAQRAARDMDQAWEEADELEVQLPLRRIGIAPADVILIPTARGLERSRVTKVHADPLGEVRVTVVVESADAFTQTVTGSAGGQATPPSPPVPTVFRAWSGREIQDSHQGTPGFYVAGSGGLGWQGGTIYWSPDSGLTWLVGGSVTQRSAFGAALSALPASGAVADTFDTTNTVQVDISGSGQTLASASDTEVLAGKNHAVLGSEILGVGIASVGSPGVYTLSRLRRGERSTTMSGHAISDQFILLGSGVVRVTVPETQIGATVQVKVVSTGQVLGDVTAHSITIATPTPQTLDGLGVDAIPAASITGVVPIAHGGTGQSTAPATNQMLIGNGSGGFTYSVIQGTTNQVVATYTTGFLTLSLPQDMHTGASPWWTRIGAGRAPATGVPLAIQQTNGSNVALDVRHTGGTITRPVVYILTSGNATTTKVFEVFVNQTEPAFYMWGNGQTSFGTSVSGARVRARGAGTSTGLTALFEDSTGTALFTVRDDGGWALKGGTVALSETGWSVTNPVARRTFDPATVTHPELAEAVGTIILALRDKGVLKS